MLRFTAPPRLPKRFAEGEWNRYEDLAAAHDQATEEAYLAGVEEARTQLSTGAIVAGALLVEAIDWLRVRNRVQGLATLPYLGALHGATRLVDLGPGDTDAIAARATDLAREYADKAVAGMRDGLREAMADGLARGLSQEGLETLALNVVGLGPRFARAVVAYEKGLLAKGVDAEEASGLAGEYAKRLRLTQARGAARTAMTAAVAIGQLAAWNEALLAGRVQAVTKTWRVNRDGRLCERCARMSGKTVALNEQFLYDDAILLDGPPGHHACRCVLEVKGKKTA